MKTKIVLIITFVSTYMVSMSSYAQEVDVEPEKHSSSIFATYLYATETLFVSPREAGLVKIFYGTGDAEENFFKTHTFNVNYSLSEKYQIGVGLKYGNNFYRSSSKRRSDFNDGERDYDSYRGLGVSGQIQLFKFGAKENDYPFRVINMVTLQYVRFEGIEVEGGFSSRSQREVVLHGLHAESGVIINYIFNDGSSPVRVFYQPLSFQVGTYGLGFQYNGFGLTIKF